MSDRGAKFVDRAREALEDCGEALGQLSATCCIPGRSERMNGLFAALQKAMYELQYGDKTPESLADCMEHVAACGGRIGNLYVTCCTDTREVLYRRLLKQLNLAYNSLGAAAGQGH